MFKKIKSLIKVSSKESLSRYIETDSKKVKIKKEYLISFIAIIFASIFLVGTIIEESQGLVYSELFIKTYMIVLVILVIMQAIVSMMNIMYFSEDLKYIISLPIKPIELLFSKYLSVLINIYITLIFIGLIPLLRIGENIGDGIGYYINIILIIILIPIIPTVCIGMLNYLLINIIKVIKSKKIIQYISTLIATLIFLALVLVIFSNISTMGSIENVIDTGVKIVNNIAEKTVVLDAYYNVLINNNTMQNWVIILGINIIFLVVFFLIGQKVYIKGILITTYYKKIKNNKVNYKKKCNKKNNILMYIQHELKILTSNILFISSTIVNTGLFNAVIIVLIVCAKIFVIDANFEISELMNLTITPEIICIFMVLIQIIWSFSRISLISFSKERQNLLLIKSMPINQYKIYLIKNSIEIAITGFTSLIIAGLMIWIIPNAGLVDFIGISVLLLLLNILNSNIISYIDLKRPNLIWKNEVEIINRNHNKIFQYITSFIIVLLTLYVSSVATELNMNAIEFYLVVGGMLLCIVSIFNYRLYKKSQKNKLFDNIN